MPIVVNLDVMLARRKWRLNDLAQAVGITPQNLSVLNAGRARAVRFSTLDAICRALDCQPGDLLEYRAGDDPAAAEVQHDEGMITEGVE
ncbi:MAG: helix-turn-helix transcriptional regulator [Verrucomicrobiales bacterium]|nr:helix-turn-helix transcriptional regulator [Verrucomicrobiales bacterium]